MPHLRENLDLVPIITASSVMLKLVGGRGGGRREREIPVHVESHHIPRYYTLNICRIRTCRTDGRVSPLPSVGNTWVFVETQLVLLVYSMVLLTRTTHGYALWTPECSAG